jgi:bacillaene synthase trans-acting acyltransferase/trans-AT polyketide synthase/acyltransferase/oxidoreductase domain-containing protein
MPRTIMMFCGQGAQYYQMGRELYRENPDFRQAMGRCDEIAARLGVRPASDIVYSRPLGDSEQFDRLSESNVALLAIGFALAQALFGQGVRPDRLLGYSLGETVAAVVAGVLSLEDGLRLVHGQARLFEQFGPPGAMVAVLASDASVRACLGGGLAAEIAAINAPRHCVVSVAARDLPVVCQTLERAGLVWARLPIRYPFHAAPIEALAEPMSNFLAGFRFQPPRLPIISAATGGIVERIDAAHIWRVMRGALRFRDTIEALAREGEWMLVEAGPSGTLASFTRQIGAPGIDAWPAIDQFGQNARTMQKLVAAVT